MAKPAPDRVRVSGPLAAFADGFFVDLVEQGYRLWPAQRHLEFLASVSRWMEAEGLGVEELTSRRWSGSLPSADGLVTGAACHRRACGRCWAISAGLACFPPAMASRSHLSIGYSPSFAAIC